MFFGLKGFISGIPREMTCRSLNVTQVFYCSREDLINVLKEDPIGSVIITVEFHYVGNNLRQFSTKRY